ncbi:uncharacterized protein ACWYII_028540 isoform 4-T5 [Salvelinus alpinus]
MRFKTCTTISVRVSTLIYSDNIFVIFCCHSLSIFRIVFTMFGCEERRSKNKRVQRARDRIKKDGEMTNRIAELDSICGVMQKAEFEGSTQAGSMKTLKLRELTQQRETELGKTALTMVRRAALQALLEHERQQYVIELNRLGKTIYKQRV